MHCPVFNRDFCGHDATTHAIAHAVMDPLIACLPLADVRRVRRRERWRKIVAAYSFFLRHPIAAYERHALKLMSASMLGGPIAWLRMVWRYATCAPDEIISDEQYARRFVYCWIRFLATWRRDGRLDDLLLPLVSRGNPEQQWWYLMEFGEPNVQLTKEMLTIFRTHLIAHLRVAPIVIPCDISDTLAPLQLSMSRSGTIRATTKRRAWLKLRHHRHAALPPQQCSAVFDEINAP
ncbi:MAG: hypothetical protein Q7S96_03205 [bacterium]|nr:hypothetical protein [bacterium]